MHRLIRRSFAGLSCALFRVALLVIAAAIGTPGLLAQSDWAPADQTSTTNHLSSVVFGNGTFVAVGNSGTILTSPDGATWTPRSSGTSLNLSKVAFGNGVFLAAGSAITDDVVSRGILRSTDAVNWTPAEPGIPLEGGARIVFAEGKFVISNGVGSVLNTPDGVTWTDHSWPADGDGVRHLAYGNGRFIGLQHATRDHPSLISEDGATWVRSNFITEHIDIHELLFFNGTFVAVGRGSQNNSGRVITSPDGQSWSAPPIPLEGELYNGTVGNGIILAVGGGGILYTSTDGQRWVRRLPTPSNAFFNDAARGNGRFVLVGNAGAIAHHADTFPAPALVSFGSLPIAVDETNGALTVVVQRAGNLSNSTTVDVLTPTPVPITFSPGQAAASVVLPITYNPERSSNTLGRDIISLSLKPGIDTLALEPNTAAVAVLDHEASIRFANVPALDVTLNPDGTGKIAGQLLIENIGSAASRQLRARITAVPIGVGGFPTGFNSLPRTLGFTQTITALQAGNSVLLPLAGVAPAQLISDPSTSTQTQIIYWEIFASLEEKTGEDWLLVDRWMLFEWERPANFASPRPAGLLSFRKLNPISTSGATISTSPVLAPVLTLAQVRIDGPATVTSGVIPNYTLVARLSDGGVCTAPPTWSTSFGNISSTGRLTTPGVTEPTAVTITGAITFNGIRSSASMQVQIEPPRTPVITSPRIVFATTGLAFRYRITALNAPTSFGGVGLPAEFSLNAATGVITATPAQAGIFPVTISASNATGADEEVLELRVFDPSPLVVTQTGNGTLSAPYPGTELRSVGTVYTIVAKPAPGWLFDGWSGGVSSSKAKLVFTMTEGLSVHATFVENPFPATKGTYAGLLTVFPQVPAGSGWIKVTVSKTGRFTGSVVFGGLAYPIKGRFDNDRKADMIARRPGKAPLAVTLQLDVLTAGAWGISGTLFDGEHKPIIAAQRAIALLPENRGFHTASIGTGQGNGFGVIHATRTGQLAFVGKLPDGTALSFSAPVITGNLWPIYAALYRKGGFFLGNLNVRSTSTTDLDGTAQWFVPGPSPQLLSGSFEGYRYDARTPATSARFLPGIPEPSGTGNIQFNFEAGNLDANIEISANLSGSGKVQPLTVAENLKCKLQASRGLFKGGFTPPGGPRRAFQGVLCQKQNVGIGFFLGEDSAGTVTVSPK